MQFGIDLTRATHSEYKELALNSSESSSNTDSVINNECTNNTTINSATDADRLTQFGDSDFYYDEFGNQIRETGKGIKTRREYNAFNQLSCFNNNGTLTQYDYDPLGRRIAKHTEHGKIDYIWDNDQLIGECQHGEYTWYINLPNQFHPVALIKQGEVYYYHLDQLNTPRFVTNNKAEVVWENKADVYGYEEPEAESDFNKESSFTQPIRFQGQYLDEESGLHYNRYRYYSPKQQRFINQDPIGLVGGINHYQYAPNPVNWVDPFGLLCKEGQAKVKAALDAKPEISGDLRSQIENICKQEQSGCTADEMVEQINAFDAVTGGLDLFVSGLLNSVVDVVAGGAGIVTLAMSGGDVDAAVHTIESVQSNQIGPFTDAGQAVSEKLAPIVQEYYEDNMAAFGDATLEATGSPALATMAHKSVEVAATLAGGKTVLNGAKGLKVELNTPEAGVLNSNPLPIKLTRDLNASNLKISPETFNISNLTENKEVHALFIDALKSKAAGKGAYARYLNHLESGLTPEQVYKMDKPLVTSAFGQVSAKYTSMLREQHALGNLLEIPDGPLHHWNYNKGNFPDQIFEPRNLYPTKDMNQHINEVHALTTSGHITKSPINPELVLEIDTSYFPLP